MKLIHKLDPLMRISKPSDNIQTFGCFQISINFMVYPEGTVTAEQMTDVIRRMTKAAVAEIEKFNKEEEEKCPTSSDTPNEADTKSSGVILEQ